MLKEVDLRIFEKLQFRMKFQLDERDITLISKKGHKKIRSHAIDLIFSRLGQVFADKDGKQTPYFDSKPNTLVFSREALS